MIYLDNAATTYPKPFNVRKRISESFAYAANPGRAGHRMSIKASEVVFDCRNKISNLFSIKNPENVIFTPSCTFALNTVIKGVLNRGDHVVISSLEHNSVSRVVEKLKDSGLITYSVAKVYEGDDDATVDSFRSHLRNNTKLVVCTHASNVFGIKLPISRIGALCKFYGILFCVDGAQTTGIIDTNLNTTDIDYFCAPGHKGLYGPMGIGFMIINTDTIPDSLYEGGTGSGSSELTQPLLLPDKFESGTLNLHAIAGLSAGVDFIKSRGISRLYHQELSLISYLYDNLRLIKGVNLYTNRPSEDSYVPLLSFNIDGYSSDEVASILNNKYSIAVRAGLHCSPLAHRHKHTDEIGTVRVCPSAFTTASDINSLIGAIKHIIHSKNFTS